MTKRDDACRCYRLGDIGEKLAARFLARNGFTNIRSTNAFWKNYPYADIVAERDGVRYVISVKIRNKWERSGSLNSRYKLGAKCFFLARHAEAREQAVAAWLTIALEAETVNAYFGLLKQLLSFGLNGKGVPMTPKYTEKYECLAQDEPHDLVYQHFRNT